MVEAKHLQPSDPDVMELYLDLHSQPCRSVFLFAKAVGIPFEFKLVDLAAGNPTLPDRHKERVETF